MRLEAHQAALRAAAKVAFSVALLGCGGASVTSEGSQPESTSGDGYDTSQADLRARKKHPRATCDSGTQSCAQMQGASKEACCEAVVNAAFPNGNDFGAFVADASADVKACCQVVAEAVDRRSNNQGMDEDAGTFVWPRTQCCSALGWQGSLACTPWGPPTPPAMRRRAPKADVAAEAMA